MHLDDDDVDPFGIPGRPDLSLDDAAVSYDELNRQVSLIDRTPDWRTLMCSCRWYRTDGVPVCLTAMPTRQMEALIAMLEEQCEELHAQAAADEKAAMSSAMRWAHQAICVPFISDVSPAAWLESMPLVRAIRYQLALPW